jgi:hypothetical protein
MTYKTNTNKNTKQEKESAAYRIFAGGCVEQGDPPYEVLEVHVAVICGVMAA